ncbi:MAG: tRNA lysidine(34) synthetase TilS [Chloroflexi bacterium]|nr:tRNA lysidine(34) synthetase TilS [Chloroflexota bacterium]
MPFTTGALESRVGRYVKEYGLLEGGEMVLVAVSGGPDSVCLLKVLNNLKDILKIQLHAAHLDHCLRGDESQADAEYVAELTAKLGIPCSIEKRDVEELRKLSKTSLEEAAREVRYRFLDEVAGQVGATRVAVGHTRDDQVETILMHYLRGAGVQGMRGLRAAAPMPYGSKEEGVWVVRPLLKASRQETGAYCQAHDLKPCTDLSNSDTKFLRNRIRLELIPLLRQYNPEIDDALVRLADIAGEDADFIDEQASAVCSAVATREGGLTCLDSGKLRGLPLALQRRVFRIILEQSYGSLRDIEATHIEALVRLLFGNTGKCVHLPGGIMATNERNRIVVAGPGASACPWPVLEQAYTLNIPGETRLPGWRVTADMMGENFFRDDDIFSASFDMSKTGRQLTVRGRCPGDRFHPLGMTHSRKLQDFMVDSAIPRSWRHSVPIVCSGEQIIWVVGWRIDDRVKVSNGTEGVLRLEFHRAE